MLHGVLFKVIVRINKAKLARTKTRYFLDIDINLNNIDILSLLSSISMLILLYISKN